MYNSISREAKEKEMEKQTENYLNQVTIQLIKNGGNVTEELIIKAMNDVNQCNEDLVNKLFLNKAAYKELCNNMVPRVYKAIRDN